MTHSKWHPRGWTHIPSSTWGMIEAFLDTCAAERGSSHNTLLAYARDLVSFFTQCPHDPRAITHDHIITYIQHLYAHDPHMKAATHARKLSALRQFFGFLREENHITKNPTHHIPMPRKDKRLPKYLSGDEVIQLIDALDTTDKESVRLLAILELLYATGLRVSELVTLPFSAYTDAHNVFIRGQTPLLRVRGKGHKERIVPISEPAMVMLAMYTMHRPAFLGKIHNPLYRKRSETYLFPSNGAAGHITRQRIDQLLKDLAVRANLDRGRLSPHVLRHAFATHLLEGGANLLAIQKMLGHEHLSTTEIYTHILPKHIANMLTSHHPLQRTYTRTS